MTSRPSVPSTTHSRPWSTRRRRTLSSAAGASSVIALVALAAPGAAQATSPTAGTAATTPRATSLPPLASAALTTLRVRAAGSIRGYTRAQFGQAWSDAVSVNGGHNGCDTRNDILRRDLTALVVKPGTRGCVAQSGRLLDRYSGTWVPFSRVQAGMVEIDHVVSLSDAWVSGAARLSPAKRADLANDPLNLRAVSTRVNRAKGAKSAATWLPVPAFRCAYVAQQIAVKRRYGLSVTAAERTSMQRVLRSCPAQRIPTAMNVPATIAPPAPRPVPAPAPAPSPRPAPAPAPIVSAPVYYANCDAVRAAGKAPLYRSQPGYRSGLDRDNDGVACE